MVCPPLPPVDSQREKRGFVMAVATHRLSGAEDVLNQKQSVSVQCLEVSVRSCRGMVSDS